MWTRSELKSKAKVAFKPIYWKSVFAAIIYTLFTYTSNAFTNKEDSTQSLTESVREALSNGTVVALVASIFGVALIIHVLLVIFLKNPMEVGYARFLLDSSEKDPKEVSVKTCFSYYFKGRYTDALVAITTTKIIIALWSFLFIVPGIIKALEYRMVSYILAEDNTLTGKEARAKSREMMKGHKWNSLVLDFSFIGWWFLTVLTGGILSIFWTTPYYNLTEAELYKALKEQA